MLVMYSTVIIVVMYCTNRTLAVLLIVLIDRNVFVLVTKWYDI